MVDAIVIELITNLTQSSQRVIHRDFHAGVTRGFEILIERRGIIIISIDRAEGVLLVVAERLVAGVRE